MTFHVSKLLRLRMIQESSFGADMSGSMGSFFEVPCLEEPLGTVTLNEPVKSPMHSQQLLDGYAQGVLLPRTAVMDITCPLTTTTTKATSTVTASQEWLGYILECVLGGKSLATGTVTTTATTAITVPVSVATSLHPGCAIGLPTGTGGALEVREIKSKSGSSLSLKLAASSAPSNGATVYGAATYFPDPYSTSASFIGLQAAWEGQNPNDRYLLRGGWCSAPPVVTTALGEMPTIKFQFTFADWDRANGTAQSADLTGSVLGRSTYTGINTLVLADSELRHAINASTTLTSSTLLAASTVEFQPAVSFATARTPAGTNTYLQAIRVHSAPVIKGSFTVPLDDERWLNARLARTRRMIQLQIGSSAATGAVALSAPSAQITDVQRADVDGIMCHKVSWEGALDEDTTVETGYENVGYAAFRIHRI